MRLIEAKSEVTGAVFKVLTRIGEQVLPEQEILIIESMKMEIPVLAEHGGVLHEILVKEGQPVAEGQTVALIEIR